jgi:type I restriction enzyme M protein
MANPPFNVSGIDKDRIKNDPRYNLGMPNTDNGNYLWIESFYRALNDNGRAGFVMANSASDARNTELEIRKKLIKEKVVDVMVAIGPNMFYTVTLPCQLWFLDKRKKNTDRADKVLFLDVRHIFNQIDRAHREFTPQQIEFIANIVNLYRGEEPEFKHGSEELFKEHKLSVEKYEDSLGLCKVATIDEIENQGWTLNPGRYVGIKEGKIEDVDFVADFEKLTEDLSLLNAEAHELEELIEANSQEILNGSTE